MDGLPTPLSPCVPAERQRPAAPSTIRRLGGLLGFAPAPPVRLLSPLPPPQCLHKLHAAVDSPWLLTGVQPVIGSIGARRAKLHRRVWYGNSFQPRLVCDIAAEGDGTYLVCRVRWHPAIATLTTLWFIAAAAGSLAALVVVLARLLHPGNADPSPARLAWLVAPPAALLLGAALVRLGNAVARDDPAFLADFVRRTLDAKPA